MDEAFIFNVLEIVAEIPVGKVASYGQIARLAGYPRNARQVGKSLARSSLYGEYPCHRVMRSDGKLVEGWDAQQALLEAEGVIFLKPRQLRMRVYQWEA